MTIFLFSKGVCSLNPKFLVETLSDPCKQAPHYRWPNDIKGDMGSLAIRGLRQAMRYNDNDFGFLSLP